ncbi:MAG: hypothetical protein ACOCRX_01675 [Candidatus Woesearchaeota archaeon]
MKLITYILIFLLFGAFLIQVNYEFNLKDKEDQRGFLYHFGSWVSNLFSNVKTLTGYAIRMDWLPDGTNVTDALDSVMNQSGNNVTNNSTNKTNTVDENSNDTPKVIVLD